MGGDALSIKTKRLTNEEFIIVVKEVLERVQKLCRRIQVYPPMPQKQTHGDVDFLVILEKGRQPKEIPQHLQSREFVEDKHGRTLNCEYKGYQVDFKLTESDADFEMAIFYKSFSGIGSFFGYLTHSEALCLSEKGLIAIKYITPTIKHKHLVTNKPHQVLELYGVDPQRYDMGFQRKQDLFRYLGSCRFFDYEQFVKDEGKNPSKLLHQFRQFCLGLPKSDPLTKKHGIKVDNFCELLLYETKQKEMFDNQINKIERDLKRTRQVKDKFNGKHIMDIFGIPTKRLNELKKKFRDYFKTEEQYQDFILNNKLDNIAQLFKKVTLQQ